MRYLLIDLFSGTRTKSINGTVVNWTCWTHSEWQVLILGLGNVPQQQQRQVKKLFLSKMLWIFIYAKRHCATEQPYWCFLLHVIVSCYSDYKLS